MTACTLKRKKILADASVVHLLRESWGAADHWLVRRYVVLLDQMHLFCPTATRVASGTTLRSTNVQVANASDIEAAQQQITSLLRRQNLRERRTTVLVSDL